MTARRRSRNAGIVAASLAVHVVVLALVAIHAPRLRIPVSEPGLPEAIIPILIMPRAPPPAAAPGSKPAPIRLHRRPQRFALEPLPLAPLVAPEAAPAPKASPAPGPRVIALPSSQDPVAANARKALRGRLGCNNANLLNLSRAEREACEDALASGGKQADFPGLGIDADKNSALARAARRKEENYDYKRSGAGGPGVSGSGYNSDAIARPGAPNMGMGASSQDLGNVTGSDKPAAKVPF